ncbi:MAG: hypothetical protein R3E60_00815 [Alphaproteobacteria bacterium]
MKIDVDMKYLFSGFNTTTVLLKIRDNRKTSNSSSKLRNWRIGLSGSGNRQSNTDQNFTYDGYQYEVINSVNTNTSIAPVLGRERIRSMGRFGLHYGMDLSPRFRYSKKYDALSGDHIPPEYVPIVTKFFGIGLSAIPFIGMKYRLNDRISFSIETAISGSYEFSSTKIVPLHTDKVRSRNNMHLVSYNVIPLRFLSFNYHFGQS